MHRSLFRSWSAPLHDIYSFWLLVFILYTTIPPLLIILGISTYDPFNRLMVLNPTQDELIIYLNYIVFSLGGFLGQIIQVAELHGFLFFRCRDVSPQGFFRQTFPELEIVSNADILVRILGSCGD